jgi:WD40 repeat protein
MGSNASSTQIYIFDGQTGKLRRTLPGFSRLTFSPDGRLLANAKEDGTVQLWNVEPGASLASLRGHSKQKVQGILFSPDGARLASFGDGGVRVWGIPAANVVIARAGINVVEKGIGAGYFTSVVPKDWLAKGTTPPRYELDLAPSTLTLRSCAYTGGHTLRLRQLNIAASITDLQSNRVIAQRTFYGKYESLTCPNTHSFIGKTDESTIGQADEMAFAAWLRTTMKSLGFAAPTATPGSGS